MLHWLISAALAIPMLIGGLALLFDAPTASAACAALPTDKGKASYTLSVSTTATYRVWARLYPASGNNNGIYMQIDNSACNVVIGHNAAIPAGQFTWVDYGNSPSSKINASLSAGNHTLTLAGYDPSVSVDKMLFLTDTACTPAGDGSNCTSTAAVTPAPGGGTAATPIPGSTTSGGSAGKPSSSPTPVAIGSGTGTKPIPVSGTVPLVSTSAPAGSTVTYKIDGKPVSGGALDTTQLSDGLHTIEQVVTTADGQTQTNSQAIKVENAWQYQIVRAINAHPLETTGVIVVAALALGLGGMAATGHAAWLTSMFGGAASAGVGAATMPVPPGLGATPVQPQTVYPESLRDENPHF